MRFSDVFGGTEASTVEDEVYKAIVCALEESVIHLCQGQYMDLAFERARQFGEEQGHHPPGA